MVMDEDGRNGGKWHLAQQLAQHVIIQKQRITQPHVHSIHNNNYHTDMGGIFISLISIKNFPPYPIIIIYNLLTNR